jgi:PAS domain S-box-containing protein
VFIAVFRVALATSLLLAFFLPTLALGQRRVDAIFLDDSAAFRSSLTDDERAWLRDHPVIRVGHDPSWSPMEFTDERGVHAGMSADYLAIAEARLGVTFERVHDPSWQDAYTRMKRWEIDVAPCVAITPERSSFWEFTEPYLTIPIVVATQREVTYVGDMRELVGKSVAVVEGYAIDGWLTRDVPDINLVRVANPDAGIALVQKGEAFAYIDNLLIIGSHLAKANIYDIKVAGQTPYTNAQRMAVRKDWEPLARILDKALRTIPEKKRNEIYRKWLPVRYERMFDYALFLRALAVFAAVLLGLTYWNEKLRREVSSRKKAEHELRASELRFRAMVETFPLAIYLSRGPEQKTEYVNPMFAKLFGYTVDNIECLSDWYHLAFPDASYRAAVSEEWARRAKNAIDLQRSAPPLEVVVTCKDGSKKDACWYFIALGDLTYACGLDLTARKQAESVVATEKERLAVTLRSIGEGVITTDLNGNIVLLNRVAEELCGWAQTQAQGEPIARVFRVVRGAGRAPVVNAAEKVLVTGEAEEFTGERWLVALDGTERLITDSAAPIKDRDGIVLGVVLVFRDITEEQKLLESMWRADRLEALGLLAGGIAHDFNNLLAGFFGCVELAKANSDPKSRAAMYLESALSALPRAKGLTHQLLTFSRGGAPIRSAGALGPWLRETTLFALSGSNVACSFNIAETLWRCDYDQTQIGRVIDNIVINAVQSMPRGGSLQVTAENVTLKEFEVPNLRHGHYVRISFSDTGTGISPDVKPRIFDPFFTTKEKGTGLGLAAAYSIIKKHEGEITVDSHVGAGTTFRLILPASDDLFDAPPVSEPRAHRGQGRVLVMDDDRSVQTAIGGMLEIMGYDVAYAADGKEATRSILEANATGHPFRIALVDLTIPGGLGGEETVTHLRSAQADLLVFVVSGYSEGPIMANPTRYGFTDSLRKPFTGKELTALFERHVGRTSARSEKPDRPNPTSRA